MHKCLKLLQSPALSFYAMLGTFYLFHYQFIKIFLDKKTIKYLYIQK